MNQTLIEALVNDLPFVRNLHSRIEKLEQKNNKLKEKRNLYKKKYNAIVSILHDYPSIMKQRKQEVIDLTLDDCDIDEEIDLKNSIIDFTNSLNIVKTDINEVKVKCEFDENEVELCKNTDCVAELDDENIEKCNICDGYYKDDGLNDILFIEEEPNNTKGTCDLCKNTDNIVQMKNTGQYICQNACDEEEDEQEEDRFWTEIEKGDFVKKEEEAEVEAEEEAEEEAEAEEEEEQEEEEQEEVEEEEVEEAEEEAEEEVEEAEEEVEEEEEEDGEVFDIIINGKHYYVDDEINGNVYEFLEDEDVGDCIGKMVKGKLILQK